MRETTRAKDSLGEEGEEKEKKEIKRFLPSVEIRSSIVFGDGSLEGRRSYE